jgi:hypothetical protein
VDLSRPSNSKERFGFPDVEAVEVQPLAVRHRLVLEEAGGGGRENEEERKGGDQIFIKKI